MADEIIIDDNGSAGKSLQITARKDAYDLRGLALSPPEATVTIEPFTLCVYPKNDPKPVLCVSSAILTAFAVRSSPVGSITGSLSKKELRLKASEPMTESAPFYQYFLGQNIEISDVEITIGADTVKLRGRLEVKLTIP